MRWSTGLRTLGSCAVGALILSGCGSTPDPLNGYQPPASYYALPSAAKAPASTWSQGDQSRALMLMLGVQGMNAAMRPQPGPAYRAPIQCNNYQYRTVCW